MLGALIWGMLSLLGVVDPVLSLKVTTLKDVASVYSSLGRSSASDKKP
jgi:hypothetical protein